MITDSDRLHKLRAIAQSGLGGMGATDFLALSRLPYPPELEARSADRILVLRLTAQRQSFAMLAAADTIEVLNQRSDLTVDDAFMFTCEAVRVFLSLNRERDAIEALLRAEAFYPNVSAELQDYLHVTHSVLYTFLGDHEARLQASLRVQRTPPPEHPYHLNLNPGLARGNVTWALVVAGRPAEALPGAQAALDDIRQRFPGGGTHAQFEVNTLHLRAMLGEDPDPAEFTRIYDPYTLKAIQGSTAAC
ncbi:hypothetical protein D3875_00395 [Deinococcus cavernae]|uniref:Tetratricopeptide repeat protein n=1 Tax=Deinococcus cavernae TaxID=2320857 RepID=A0A418VID7_9DEIO|nr:hypothetical protein [Deinococcus cavernae]RJF75925.1 hypothetical protein D3875_00395 [Deinococcus cavernae]